MALNMYDYISTLAGQLKPSPIRELARLLSDPSVISLAGGSPAPETFPYKELIEITQEVLEKDYWKALQYSSTEGLNELREFLVGYLKKDGIDINLDNIIITSGSQQGLDLTPRVLIDPGDVVIAEMPTFLAALNAFRSYGADLRGVNMQSDGLDVENLRALVTKCKAEGKKVKFLYSITNFSNPTGITLSLEKRKQIVALAEEEDFFILEDNPYEKMRFSGEFVPSMYSLCKSGRVIHLGSFSKILAPGIRLAWILGNEEFIRVFGITKQVADMSASIFGQHIANAYCRKGYLDTHIPQKVHLYKEKRDAMLAAMDKCFPKELKWTLPEGGFFTFVTMPEYIDCNALYAEALEQKVAYVIGKPFFVDGSGINTLRLSFSMPSIPNIEKGIDILGKLFASKIR